MAQYKDGLHTEKYKNGTLGWWKNGQYHRDGDLPAVITANVRVEWRQNGELHRDGDKPAYIDANGNLQWWQNGQTHRICGPAVIWADGTLEWWINGEEITQEVRAWLNRKRWRGTPEQIVEFQLRFT